MTASQLYVPPDVDEAYELWGANCGPGALAAIAGRPLSAVRALFPHYPRTAYANPTHLKAALTAAGLSWGLTGTRMPSRGLAFLQIGGPWCAPGVPIGAAYRKTHWVAVDRGLVYDANAPEWLTPADWEADIMARILAQYPQADGWSVRTGIEVPA